MSKLIAFVSSFIAVFLAIGMAAYFRYYAPAGTFLHPELDAASVVRQVRRLNDLVPVRCGVERVVTVDGRLLMIRGHAAAAVNLSGFNQYDVESLRGSQAVLRIPAPRVLDITVDPSATEAWDARHAMWTAWADSDRERRQRVVTAATEGIRESAIAMGILEEARRKARQTVSAFLGALGITQVRFQEE
jgi:hypothetical protein